MQTHVKLNSTKYFEVKIETFIQLLMSQILRKKICCVSYYIISTEVNVKINIMCTHVFHTIRITEIFNFHFSYEISH